MGKNTYDAEIEITNKDYLQSLYTSTGVEAVSTPNDFDDVQVLDSAIVQVLDSAVSQPLEALFNDSLDIIKDTISIGPISSDKKVTSTHGVGIYAGIGFNAVSILGPAISLGICFNNIHIETSFILGLEKAENIGINYTETASKGFLGEVYDYSCSQIAVKVGYALKASNHFYITPLLGVAFNMIRGDNKIKSGSLSQFNSITQMSASAGLCLDLQLGKVISLYAMPYYNFIASANDAYKVIKEADNKIQSWCEGFGVGAGIKIHF